MRCSSCHLPSLAGQEQMPRLARQRIDYMIEAMKAAGGSPRYSEFSGIGHDAWTPAYGDPAVLDWLFNQRRDQSK